METLTGQELTIPGAFGAKPVVLVWSFSRKAGEATKAWMEPLEKEGIAVWSATMLESAPRFVRPMIRAGMRKDFNSSRQEHVLLFYQCDKQWRQLLRVRDMDVALLVVSFLWQLAARMYHAQFQETVHA